MKLIFLVVSIVLILTNFKRQTQAIVSYMNGTIFEAKEGDILYIALIKVLHPHTGRFMPICAGAIISEYDVLTNAVCATACQSPPNCKLYVGRVNVSADGTEVKINSTTWHHTYWEMDMMDPANDTRFNILDLGIIHTEQIEMSDTVQIIAMNVNDSDICHIIIDVHVTVISGWGAEPDAAFLDEPKQHEILQYGKANCYFGQWGPSLYHIVHSTKVQIGFKSHVIGSISDMGAPMVRADSEQLIGVGSYTLFIYDKFDAEDNLLIYFPVFENLAWIQAHMRANSVEFLYEKFRK